MTPGTTLVHPGAAACRARGEALLVTRDTLALTGPGTEVDTAAGMAAAVSVMTSESGRSAS